MLIVYQHWYGRSVQSLSKHALYKAQLLEQTAFMEQSLFLPEEWISRGWKNTVKSMQNTIRFM